MFVLCNLSDLCEINLCQHITFACSFALVYLLQNSFEMLRGIKMKKGKSLKIFLCYSFYNSTII